jgi:hypothetical protein
VVEEIDKNMTVCRVLVDNAFTKSVNRVCIQAGEKAKHRYSSVWEAVVKDLEELLGRPRNRKIQLSLMMLSICQTNIFFLALYNSVNL